MAENNKKKFSYELVQERIHSLPTLPAVVAELMTLSQESNNYLERIVELASLDPPLAARILRVANSASSAANSEISDLHEALVRLGVIKVVSLVSTLAVAQVFEAKDEEHKAIWRHSIETACLCKTLAQLMPEFQTSPQLAYTCGLLHDIGRFILLRISPSLIIMIDEKGWTNPEQLLIAEKRLIGFTHADVGALAAKEWHLPLEYIQCLHFIQRFKVWKADQISVELKRLISIVQFADAVSVFLEQNTEWRSWTEDELELQLEKQCIRSEWPLIDFHLPELLPVLPVIEEECEGFMSALGI